MQNERTRFYFVYLYIVFKDFPPYCIGPRVKLRTSITGGYSGLKFVSKVIDF